MKSDSDSLHEEEILDVNKYLEILHHDGKSFDFQENGGEQSRRSSEDISDHRKQLETEIKYLIAEATQRITDAKSFIMKNNEPENWMNSLGIEIPRIGVEVNSVIVERQRHILNKPTDMETKAVKKLQNVQKAFHNPIQKDGLSFSENQKNTFPQKVNEVTVVEQSELPIVIQKVVDKLMQADTSEKETQESDFQDNDTQKNDTRIPRAKRQVRLNQEKNKENNRSKAKLAKNILVKSQKNNQVKDKENSSEDDSNYFSQKAQAKIAH